MTDRQADPWAQVKRFHVSPRPDDSRLVRHVDPGPGQPEGFYMWADNVDAARAADAAQHAADIADCERQFDCIGADLERADAKIAQLTTVLQWALDVFNATLLGLPLPPLPSEAE